jgi:hypothetical protein
MRWLKSFAPLALVLVALPARAQDAAPPPSEPAPAEPPPPRQPPAQVFDGEQPPSPVRPGPVPTHRRTPAVEQKDVGTGFGVEVGTAGFASGNLQGGLLLGGHTPGGSIFGVRLNYRDETTKVSGSSSSTTAFAIGLAGRFPVAGSSQGFDLALAADAAFVHVESPAGPADSGSKGSGFQLAFGPQLRYWFHPNVAAGYMVQFGYTSVSSDASSDRVKVEQSVTALVGSFTLTAGF